MVYKPTYHKSISKFSFEKFKNAHKDADYFKYMTDQEWIAEYERATGNKVNKKGE